MVEGPRYSTERLSSALIQAGNTVAAHVLGECVLHIGPAGDGVGGTVPYGRATNRLTSCTDDRRLRGLIIEQAGSVALFLFLDSPTPEAEVTAFQIELLEDVAEEMEVYQRALELSAGDERTAIRLVVWATVRAYHLLAAHRPEVVAVTRAIHSGRGSLRRERFKRALKRAERLGDKDGLGWHLLDDPSLAADRSRV